MRPDVVVVEPPALEQAPGVTEFLEDLLVQQLVPRPADEALDEGILLGLARQRCSASRGRRDWSMPG
jgi:hypothetical protein